MVSKECDNPSKGRCLEAGRQAFWRYIDTEVYTKNPYRNPSLRYEWWKKGWIIGQDERYAELMLARYIRQHGMCPKKYSTRPRTSSVRGNG